MNYRTAEVTKIPKKSRKAEEEELIRRCMHGAGEQVCSNGMGLKMWFSKRQSHLKLWEYFLACSVYHTCKACSKFLQQLLCNFTGALLYIFTLHTSVIMSLYDHNASDSSSIDYIAAMWYYSCAYPTTPCTWQFSICTRIRKALFAEVN